MTLRRAITEDLLADRVAIRQAGVRVLLDQHDAMVRSELRRFRGREVITTGDGILASFDGPHEQSDAPSGSTMVRGALASTCEQDRTPARSTSAVMTSAGSRCTLPNECPHSRE
jgi:hypothetical protein